MKLTLRIEKEDIRPYNETTGVVIITQLCDVVITKDAMEQLFQEYEKETDKK